MEDQPLLRAYLHFDEDDLQANRQGHLTERQKARLDARDKSERGHGLFKFAAARHKYQVGSVQGPARFVQAETASSASRWELQIGGHSFLVPQPAPEVFAAGDQGQYIVYYADRQDDPAAARSLEDVLSAEVASILAEPQEAASQDLCNLIILDAGPRQIEAIQLIHQLTGLGLGESEAVSKRPHGVVLRSVTAEEAQEAVALFEKAGATVHIEAA